MKRCYHPKGVVIPPGAKIIPPSSLPAAIPAPLRRESKMWFLVKFEELQAIALDIIKFDPYSGYFDECVFCGGQAEHREGCLHARAIAWKKKYE